MLIYLCKFCLNSTPHILFERYIIIIIKISLPSILMII